MRTFDLRREFGLIAVVALLAGILTSTGASHVAAAPASQAAPRTWTVLVGGEAGIEQQENGPAGAWQFMRFYPDTITINAGDTIVWRLRSAEPHTVTFPQPGQRPPDLVVPEGGGSQRLMLNPLAVFPQGGQIYNGTSLTGSGQMDPEPQSPKEYSLTFSGTGSFEYFCAFHMMMTGRVIVQEPGSGYPKTQEQIDADAAALLAADTGAANSIQPIAEMVSTRPGANGTTVHEVRSGWGNGLLAWMRYGPTDLTIRQGDTVVWVEADAETPHTVTLLSGGEEPELILAEPQPQGPPKLVLNPVVLEPAGGATYSGTGYFNSGFMWGMLAPIPGPRSYSLSFDTPGTFEYICVLHDEMGMKGRITVQPRS